MAKIEALIDDFSVQQPWWTLSGSPTPQWVDGRLRMLAGTGSPQVHTGTNRYDLTDSAIFAQCRPHDVNPFRQTALDLDAGTANDAMISIRVEDSPLVLRCRIRTGGVNSDTQAPYDPATMAWLRIRHAESTVYWESAPEATGPWTIARSAPTPAFGITDRRVRIWAGAWGDPGGDSYAYWDNLNHIPAIPGVQTFTAGQRWGSAYAHGVEVAELWKAGAQIFERP